MNLAGEMQYCMVKLDVERAKEIWRKVSPHLPPITSDEEMLTTLHLARTQSEAVNTRMRFYSHCWLRERGYPSALPDSMRQSADRMYPRTERSVGISLNSRSDLTRPILPLVRNAMEDAVLDIYADRKQDDIDLIKRQMMEARRTTVRKLLGVR
jgi:hypothetical protein